MMIGHDQQMNPIVLGVKGSEVKITLTLLVKQFLLRNLRRLRPRNFKLF
jgi:hypothetical protein